MFEGTDIRIFMCLICYLSTHTHTFILKCRLLPVITTTLTRPRSSLPHTHTHTQESDEAVTLSLNRLTAADEEIRALEARLKALQEAEKTHQQRSTEVALAADRVAKDLKVQHRYMPTQTHAQVFTHNADFLGYHVSDVAATDLEVQDSGDTYQHFCHEPICLCVDESTIDQSETLPLGVVN